MTAQADCARCGRYRQVKKHMPDGPLCAACFAAAVRTRGQCGHCGHTRLLPGDDGAGTRLCAHCAGITEDFTCTRCGTEWALRAGLCEWCCLADNLDDLLTGDVDLTPLRTRLLDAARPDRIMIWLTRAHVHRLLRGLATGSLPLTHQGLDNAAPRAAVDHLRGLLVATGLLPARDEHLARFERWLTEHLAALADTEQDRKVLHQFATWDLRRSMVARSRTAPLRYSQVTNATQKLRVAAQFLTWLHSRDHDLAFCTQADLDEWFATPPTTHAQARRFLSWATRARYCPPLTMPPRAEGTRQVLDQAQRIQALQRLLDPKTGSLQHRVAAMLLVLLAQPFTKIAALKTSDIITTDTGVSAHLGRGVTPIPDPFAGMITQLLTQRPHLTTATNPTSPWLFPGTRAGTHIADGTLRLAVIRMGIDLVAARSAALRQLVLDCPPPVVADMLGYSYPVIDHHAQQAGTTWATYAAIRHHAAGQN